MSYTDNIRLITEVYKDIRLEVLDTYMMVWTVLLYANSNT